MKNSFLIAIFIAIILGAFAGFLSGSTTELFGVTLVRYYDLLGNLFLNALTLVVVPVVVSAIVTGTARVGADKNFAALGSKTFGYFFLTGAIAVFLGFLCYFIVSPAISPINSSSVAGSADVLEQIKAQASVGTFDRIGNIFLSFFPKNIFAAAASGQMLGLIFFSVMFGVLSTRIESELSKIMLQFWNALFQIMMRMTNIVILAMPIGVFGLIAKVVATTGFEKVEPVLWFGLTVSLGLIVFTFVALPLLLAVIGKINPITHFRNMGPALVTAFTTSSSSATLPVTLECLEQRAKVSNRFSSFIVPLGTSVNLTGSALYATVAVLFIAQSYGVSLDAGNLVTIATMCLFIALGMVAGIPSGTFVTIVVILQALGLPAEGIILILPVERLLDMLRTPVNVFSSTCVTVLVAKSESRH